MGLKVDNLKYIPDGDTIPETLFISSGLVTVENSELRFAFGDYTASPEALPPNEATLFSAYSYDLEESNLTVRVSDHDLDPDGHFRMVLGNETDLTNVEYSIHWHPKLKLLVSAARENTTGNYMVSRNLDLTDPYLRMRHTNGTVYFEASSDAMTWTLLWQWTVSLPVNDLFVTLLANSDFGTYGYSNYGVNDYGFFEGDVPSGSFWVTAIGSGGRLVIAERFLFDVIYEEYSNEGGVV